MSSLKSPTVASPNVLTLTNNSNEHIRKRIMQQRCKRTIRNEKIPCLIRWSFEVFALERVPWRKVDEMRAMQRLKDTYARRTCSSRLSKSRLCELASSITFSCSPRRCSPPDTLPAGQVLVDKTVPKNIFY